MKKHLISRISDISSLLLLAVVLYTSQPQAPQKQTSHVHAGPPPAPVTLAALTVPSNEAYFDLIVETSECLGENLWIGGKVECLPPAGKPKATFAQRRFAVKELTATGLSTYNSYKLRNNYGTLKAISDRSGHVILQLQEGPMQLQPTTGEAPIIVAYKRTLPGAVHDDSVGNWICK
ncbi:hypothetical protein H7F15_01875 [Pontibacter sp. Tf4]|uniref:hypothetical protein n=1 Tax=Pontibacter sp. Tf4 TaxID=2761620 RepID=UPI00162921DE|nr:hypothetical protein [Pontibacter sp. Tf4]MBB6609774.1 hypothetical protein [Pontibacter sp. Tf4]